MPYQDAWVRGVVRSPGDRACAARYALVRSIVEPYTRPVTVWDLGANLGYFGCRLAAEFGATTIMVDARPALVPACQANALPSTIALTHRLSVADLQELATSEHADIVLALNVLHHFADWRGALEAVLGLGEVVLIETPGRGDTQAAHYAAAMELLDALEARPAELLGLSESHVTPGVQRPLFVFRQSKPRLTRGYAYGDRVRAKGAITPRAHAILSTLHEKRITYTAGESRAWVAGMNLWNWLQLGGSYPDRLTIAEATRRTAATLPMPHGDFHPWNLILQGRTVTAIDGGHRASCADAIGLEKTLAWIVAPETAYAC